MLVEAIKGCDRIVKEIMQMVSLVSNFGHCQYAVHVLPLPAIPFEPAVWSVAKVPNDYCISDGRNKYSVPYNLIGEKVDIRVTKNVVEVYYHGSRMACHRRLQTVQHDPLMKLEHIAYIGVRTPLARTFSPAFTR